MRALVCVSVLPESRRVTDQNGLFMFFAHKYPTITQALSGGAAAAAARGRGGGRSRGGGRGRGRGGGGGRGRGRGGGPGPYPLAELPAIAGQDLQRDLQDNRRDVAQQQPRVAQLNQVPPP